MKKTVLLLIAVAAGSIAFAQNYQNGQNDQSNSYNQGYQNNQGFQSNQGHQDNQGFQGVRERWDRRLVRERKFSFELGLCVGQTLATAQPPVTVPMPQQGQANTPPDDTTKAAIKAAIQSCRAQFSSGTANGGTTGGTINGGTPPTASPYPSPSPGMATNPITSTY